MASTAISIEDYLETSYSPDREYIDGELKEKSVVSSVHGRIQVLIGHWFIQHEDEWHLIASAEARTRTSVNRVRLPDLVLDSPGYLRQEALTAPPAIAIEVLSPSDRVSDLKRRAQDLEGMGVPNIWLIDPESRDASIWKDGYWQKVMASHVQVLNSPAYLDLAWLWLKLDQS
jgi:Uma2 family endonuclease